MAQPNTLFIDADTPISLTIALPSGGTISGLLQTPASAKLATCLPTAPARA
jgi:hypothetical protein